MHVARLCVSNLWKNEKFYVYFSSIERYEIPTRPMVLYYFEEF